MTAASDKQFANYVEEQPKPDSFDSRRVYQKWAQTRKPPRSAFATRSLNESQCIPDRQTLPELDGTYILDGRLSVIRFIEDFGLRVLLEQAKMPLEASFGRTAIKTLSVVTDEEGFKSLLCMVSVTGNLQEQRTALKAFDQRWWLDNVQSASGRLNFDFQIIDGFRFP